MKQYTTPDQTAKLIGLGFERPKSYTNEASFCGCGYTYSIGEVIEFCPRVIGRIGQDYVTIEISHDAVHWIVGYTDFDDRLTYATSNSELIDAIFDMLIKLKEKELI